MVRQWRDLNVINTTLCNWSQPYKGTGNEVTLTGGAVNFAAASIPAAGKDLWIEATWNSNSVRDIIITLDYKGESDTVKATAVWAGLFAAEHDNRDAADVLGESAWVNMTEPPRGLLEGFGGTGLRPISPIYGVRNVIVMGFEILPNGVENEPNVNFDIARRKESRAWALDQNSNVLHALAPDVFPDQNEEPNDDGRETDESTSPNAQSEMFSLDAPGTRADRPPFPEVEYFVYRGNFEEFVRVSFTPLVPFGNILLGTRSSDVYKWHTRVKVTENGGLYARSDAIEDGTNDVGDEIGGPHIQIGDSP